MLTRLFTDPLSLPQFEAERPVIAFLRTLGTSSLSIHPCLLTPFPDSMFPHTLFMSTAARTCSFTIKRCATFFSLRHHEHPALPATGITSDKRSLVVLLLSTPFFLERSIQASYGEPSLLRNAITPFIPLRRVEICGAMPTTCHFLGCHPLPSSAVAL